MNKQSLRDKSLKLKSIGAVVAGFLTVAILSTITDSILEGAGIFPGAQYQMENGSPVWLLLTALGYRSIYAIAGGYVTGKLAPQNEQSSSTSKLKLVKILAVLGTIGGVIGVFAGWKFGNQWYPIALAVTAYPLVYFGGKLAVKKD